MPDDPAAGRQRGAGAAPPGVGGLAAGVLGTLVDYWHARAALFLLEAREARGEFLIRLICGLGGAFFLLVAWLALNAGLTGWLAGHFGWPWPLVAMGLAGAHLLAGLLLLRAARRRFAEPPFRDSLNELEKDRQWLKRHRPEN